MTDVESAGLLNLALQFPVHFTNAYEAVDCQNGQPALGLISRSPFISIQDDSQRSHDLIEFMMQVARPGYELTSVSTCIIVFAISKMSLKRYF